MYSLYPGNLEYKQMAGKWQKSIQQEGEKEYPK